MRRQGRQQGGMAGREAEQAEQPGPDVLAGSGPSHLHELVVGANTNDWKPELSQVFGSLLPTAFLMDTGPSLETASLCLKFKPREGHKGMGLTESVTNHTEPNTSVCQATLQRWAWVVAQPQRHPPLWWSNPGRLQRPTATGWPPLSVHHTLSNVKCTSKE